MASAGSDADRRSTPGAVARKRTVVLEGTFSIEEIDVNPRSGNATTKTGRKQSGKKTGRKKALAKKVRAKKAPASNKAAGEPAGKKVSKANESCSEAADTVEAAAGQPVSAGTVVLDSHHDIKTIAALREQLDAAYAGDDDIVVDAAAVESMDTAALQLLLGFTNSVRKQSRTVRWDQVSESLRELADRTDLVSALELPDRSDEDDDGLCPVF